MIYEALYSTNARRRYQPDKILLYVGTSNLFSAKNANKIVSKVIKLVNICKRINVNIIVSEIVSHEDDLNAKGKAVNKCKFNKVRFLEN